MKDAIYGWAVLNRNAPRGQHWRIFKSRRLARAYRDAHGGDLYKIEKSH